MKRKNYLWGLAFVLVAAAVAFAGIASWESVNAEVSLDTIEENQLSPETCSGLAPDCESCKKPTKACGAGNLFERTCNENVGGTCSFGCYANNNGGYEWFCMERCDVDRGCNQNTGKCNKAAVEAKGNMNQARP